MEYLPNLPLSWQHHIDCCHVSKSESSASSLIISSTEAAVWVMLCFWGDEVFLRNGVVNVFIIRRAFTGPIPAHILSDSTSASIIPFSVYREPKQEVKMLHKYTWWYIFIDVTLNPTALQQEFHFLRIFSHSSASFRVNTADLTKVWVIIKQIDPYM